MTKLWSLFLALFLTISLQAQDNRNVSAYNLDGGLGLKGFDPVSYFPEGGGVAVKGDSSIVITYEGATYHFASEENAAMFNTMPERYEPTYGGFCAWAMANGSRVDIKPEIFTLDDNRLHFFVARRAKRNFDRDIEGFSKKADGHWRRISGEEPRL